MDASYNWLRELCPVTATAEEAAEALTRRGLTVDAVRPIGDDTQFEIDIPANRPDCLGHRGLARELSAAFGVALATPPAAPEPAGGDVSDSI
ncbi:MAG: phenylalanine--tRNA ligase subunit beta, partial [Acidobacteria bacterium]|nr:phenylalanine--tRNA ligase subunit beta [Acidobacteriota bacterium]NIM61003.1 phenylalanine--tRNA ligase subunit beta [Acidobacteriota bacterium]NIO59971.1 phenylalanine--tRNA ligase subunit beta [Acidobacteriota bacterium]NIQ31043.1 phenylalanine--tRNA ligase subunit beta [Acidobacteriota bacterium]NIQ86171.1 phenylalanine--tRNA ligase subunit beta [Acidobacteriota bacterium]